MRSAQSNSASQMVNLVSVVDPFEMLDTQREIARFKVIAQATLHRPAGRLLRSGVRRLVANQHA